jgi:hypothetical protein
MALDSGASAGQQVDHHEDQHHEKHDVDQAATEVQQEADEPEKEQYDDDGPE